jgi:uncharacterized protein (TIGR03000 family)
MFKELYLVPAILSVAGLLMAANSAFAQHGGHGGGGHGGGGHVSGGHIGGGHVGGGRVGGGHYGGGHVGGYGGGYHNGYYRGGYGYYPGIFGGVYPWYDTGPFYDTYPNYSYYDAPTVQYYIPPTQPVVPYISSTPEPSGYANIRVIVPDSQAHIWFDGSPTRQTGTDRLFNTPELTMGSTYSYRIRATWMQGGHEVSQEKTVSVTPGQTTLVDFAH